MTQALTLRNAADVPEADVKALAARILNNKPLFPDDLTPQQAAELAMIALATGLDPIAGELTVSFGHPLVTLDGRIRLAVGDPAFNGIEYTRPATPEERDAFRVKDHEDMWTSCVHRKGVQFPSVGYGRAGGAYETNYLAKSGARGPELARKRSIVNALRLLFPLPRLAVPGLEPLGYVVEADVDAVSDGPPPITSDQTRAIHAASRRAGYDASAYRERLREMFGVHSSQELTANQAQAAIAAFATEAEPTAEERVAARQAAPTPEERSFYEKLNAAAAASQNEEPRFFAPVKPDALADARERLRARARELTLTGPQLDGLLEHSFGRGVTLSTCTIDQAHQALELLPADAADAQEVPLL